MAKRLSIFFACLFMNMLTWAQMDVLQCASDSGSASEQVLCDLIKHHQPFLASQVIEKCFDDLEAFHDQNLRAYTEQYNIEAFHRHLIQIIDLDMASQDLRYFELLSQHQCEDVVSVLQQSAQPKNYRNIEVQWDQQGDNEKSQKKPLWRVSFEMGWHRLSYSPIDLTVHRISDGTELTISDADSFDKPMFQYLKPSWKNYASGKFLDEPQYDYALRFSKINSSLNLTFRVSQNKQSYIGSKKKDEVVLVTGLHHNRRYDHEPVLLSSIFEQLEIGSGVFNIALMPDMDVFTLQEKWGNFEVSLGIGPSIFFGAPRSTFVNTDGTTSFVRGSLQHLGWGVSNDIRLQYTLPNNGIGLYVATNTAYKKLSDLKIDEGTLDMEGGYQSSVRAGFLIPIFTIREKNTSPSE